MTTATDLQTMANQVERGILSRSAIARQHGNSTAAAVRRLLAAREVAREAVRSSLPVEPEYCTRCGKEIEACQCITTCECGAELSDDEIAAGITTCEACRKREATYQEMLVLADWAEEAALAAGWECDGWDRGRRGSWYAVFTRHGQTLKLRVADHGSCYCTEDISLVVPSGNASGDDHTRDCWLARLAR